MHASMDIESDGFSQQPLGEGDYTSDRTNIMFNTMNDRTRPWRNQLHM